ncbi:hypothetical protein K2173_023045 [Erythroxylum novogranatense]|uniref:Ribosome maturation factor RimP N-terminal domain-containing protein n=1 Tax=Erythroxylum novogranatense TaxID=1862640 RepID=A0AAV8T976_9ROSI|nr:hypothetical protein K2173_023045 [Erythroxylum novogranatense]
MELVSSWNSGVGVVSVPTVNAFSFRPSIRNLVYRFPFWTYPAHKIPVKPCLLRARKRKSQTDPTLEPSLVEEVSFDNDDEEEELLLFDDFEDETLIDGDDDDDDFDDELLEDEAELYVGDGAGGGGIALAGTWWDKEALAIAEEVCSSFDGELKIYAFKTLTNSTIRVRIERLTDKSGSPNMEDIEAFSTTYRIRLDEAGLAKTIPDNIALEVSSPGVERVVQIPEEVDRFKDRPLYVKYVNEGAALNLSSESEGVFSLISIDMEAKSCSWGLANVRVNREKAGKGRPLSKKQKEWRLSTPFDSLRLVRLYSDI